MKRRVSLVLSVAVIFILSNCAEKVMVNHPFPPKQAKKIYSAKSSGSSAPGQIKKFTGDQSAKPYAPGQQKKKKG